MKSKKEKEYQKAVSFTNKNGVNPKKKVFDSK